MLRLVLIIIFFVLSLLNFVPVPSAETWHLGILIPEFPWIFMFAMIPMLVWSFAKRKFRIPCVTIGLIAFLIFCSPVVRAYAVGSNLEHRLQTSFNVKNPDFKGVHQKTPYSFWQMLTGNGAKKIAFTTHQYATHEGVNLTLDFSPSAVPGIRPCVVVVHGGSWKRGDKSEIAHMNNYLANAGYQVATIEYRLAPKFKSPAPQEDVHAAFAWLRANATMLNIDTNNFVLMGRSAGAQIVLTAAYTLNENGLKGVAAFYGCADMFWSWDHPDNPLIMDSRLVLSDFFGGTPTEVPEKYKAGSPMLNVTAKTVPTLLVHGEIDAHVLYEQSVRLVKKLDEYHVKNMLLSLPWATHGCEYNLNGPAGQLSIYSMEHFFYSVTHEQAN